MFCLYFLIRVFLLECETIHANTQVDKFKTLNRIAAGIIILLICGNNSFAFPCSDSVKTTPNLKIYLIKNYWHVGIILPVDNYTLSRLSVLEQFNEFPYVDIGWGDEDFYQNPDVDYVLGAKALLVPTSSVVRIQGRSIRINNLIKWSDYAVSLLVTERQLNNILEFIDNSLTRIDGGSYLIVSKDEYREIIFFKSDKKYHLFYTCNTWIADALNYAGFDIEEDRVLTAQHLFEELIKIGIVEKYGSND